MDNAKRALLELLLHGCEAEPKEVKQQYKDTFNLNEELKKKSIPAKYKGSIQHLLDDQANVLTSRLAVAFKGQIKLVLLYFGNNPDLSDYAIDVVEMLTCGIVANPEDNLTNQLMDTEEVGQLSEEMANLEVKVEEMDQDSTEVVLSPVVSNDDLQLQPSTSSHLNDEEMIPVINQLPQLVTPVLEQNADNRPVVIEPPVRISKENMYKKLPLEPAKCLVRDCGKQFDYRGFRQDHIDKDHQNTKLQCALCPKVYVLYRNLDRHYLKEHAFNFQCSFPSCEFTSKAIKHVTKHFEQCHMVSAIVNNLKSTNRDNDEDDDLSEHEANSDENIQPVNQGSTAAVPSPVVQQPSTSAEPKTMKRTCVQSRNNEECNQVYIDGQGQLSVKKAKLNSTQSNIAPSVDQSRYRCIIEHCALFFDNLNDLDQHINLVHSRPNELAISSVENGLTTIQNTNVGPIVSQQSSISTEPTTSIRFEVPVGSSSSDNEECIDVDGERQSSSTVKKPKLDATHSDDAQSSQVTSQSEQSANANSTKDGRQVLNPNDVANFLGLQCFQLDCQQMFHTGKALTDHMWTAHRICAFPCLIKGCDKAFDNGCTLFDHIRNDHTDRKLHCAKCVDHSEESFNSLNAHYNRYHRAQYQCTFASCTFRSGSTSSTFDHYVQEHMTVCREQDCANKFNAYQFNFYGYSSGLKHYHYK